MHLWLNRTLRPLFTNRLLGINEDVIIRWKAMVIEGRKRGHTFGQPDLFIAAIAALEDLVVVTRDTGEFVAAGVPAFDPWLSILHAYGKETPIVAPASAEAVTEVILGMRLD
jgi:predicted nucleic acid-binding protein